MKTLTFLYIYFKFLGMCPFYLTTDGNIRLSYGGAIYAVILSVTYSVFYARAFTSKLAFVLPRKTPITQIVNFTAFSFETGALILVFLYFGLRPRRLQRILVRYRSINAAFNAHGVRSDDERFFQEIKVHIITVNVLWCLLSVYYSARIHSFEPSELGTWMPLLFLRIVNHNVVFVFVGIVKSVGRRFRSLNEKIANLWFDDSTVIVIRPRSMKRKIAKNCGIEPSRSLGPFEACGQMYADLIDLTTLVVQYFALSILVTMLFQCIQTASSIYTLSIISMDKTVESWALAWILWLIVHMSELIIVLESCDSTVNEANRTGNSLHMIMTTGRMDKYKASANALSLRLLQERSKIELFGLFPINLAIAYKIVAMITAYVTVMMQLDSQNLPE